MNTIEIKFKYWGDTIEAIVTPEQDCRGEIFPIELNGKYAFTLCMNDEKEWEILRENNGVAPSIDSELLKSILKHLDRELRYAA